MTRIGIYGVIARFESADQLVAATQAARQAGYRGLDAFAPFPVPGLPAALGFHQRRIAPLALLAGVCAAAATFALQWYSAVIDYPIVVGGKPLNSWPAFLPVSFELGILATALTAILMMLWGNGLPRPYHAVFNDPEFDRASCDGFFLLIRGGDDASAATTPTVRAWLTSQGAASIRELRA
ncbi:DUF3341 domain-containing protein [Halopseudomonas bauzanensis]|uniref:DUF3341 domain-containing protein n=1 Tax=Halopseudomonas bauzanensis TaxID=653930 RepID=UPI003524685B